MDQQPHEQPNQPPVQGTVIPKFDPKDVEDHKFMAALSYFSLLCLVPLFGMKSSRFAQEHAKQGVILMLAWIIGKFLFWIPLFGWAAAIILVCVNIYALIKCLQGEFWEIPVIGQYRSKINL